MARAGVVKPSIRAIRKSLRMDEHLRCSSPNLARKLALVKCVGVAWRCALIAAVPLFSTEWSTHIRLTTDCFERM
jgi:hypothetical protein